MMMMLLFYTISINNDNNNNTFSSSFFFIIISSFFFFFLFYYYYGVFSMVWVCWCMFAHHWRTSAHDRVFPTPPITTAPITFGASYDSSVCAKARSRTFPSSWQERQSNSMQRKLNPDNAKERSVASSILLSNDTDKTGVVGTELRKKLDTPPGTITMSP